MARRQRSTHGSHALDEPLYGRRMVAIAPPEARGSSVSDASSPYIVRNRSRVFAKPTPAPLASDGAGPGPLSVTLNTSVGPSSLAPTSIVPRSLRFATP